MSISVLARIYFKGGGGEGLFRNCSLFMLSFAFTVASTYEEQRTTSGPESGFRKVKALDYMYMLLQRLSLAPLAIQCVHSKHYRLTNF